MHASWVDCEGLFAVDAACFESSGIKGEYSMDVRFLGESNQRSIRKVSRNVFILCHEHCGAFEVSIPCAIVNHRGIITHQSNLEIFIPWTPSKTAGWYET